MCSLSRILLLAWGVGLVVATLSGNEVAGWIAGAAVGLAAYLLARRSPSRLGGTCALPDTDTESERFSSR